jgi:hypothetical protein
MDQHYQVDQTSLADQVGQASIELAVSIPLVLLLIFGGLKLLLKSVMSLVLIFAAFSFSRCIAQENTYAFCIQYTKNILSRSGLSEEVIIHQNENGTLITQISATLKNKVDAKGDFRFYPTEYKRVSK